MEDSQAWELFKWSGFSHTVFEYQFEKCEKIFLCKFAEDKTDLENSVMQKKIKIPKLSLNHLEEMGEITDYGDEDMELRHCKVLKPCLLVCSLFFSNFGCALFNSKSISECQGFFHSLAYRNADCNFYAPLMKIKSH